MKTTREQHEMAVAKAIEAEQKNMSQSTQNRRWREAFRLEDELKRQDGWR